VITSSALTRNVQRRRVHGVESRGRAPHLAPWPAQAPSIRRRIVAIFRPDGCSPMADKKMVDVFSDVERETAMTANPARLNR